VPAATVTGFAVDYTGAAQRNAAVGTIFQIRQIVVDGFSTFRSHCDIVRPQRAGGLESNRSDRLPIGRRGQGWRIRLHLPPLEVSTLLE